MHGILLLVGATATNDCSIGALAADVPANFDALLLSWAAPGTRTLIVEG